ncbi:MAG: cupin domain-containing protein [bacterium]|jgi:mannose-6-phosphate isomerase-like protein (cupin superfamily)
MNSNTGSIFVSARDSVTPFITKDGSVIREILAPAVAPGIIQKQSLAEAIVPSGETTDAHYHPITEEIYYILRGEGRIQLGNEVRPVVPGDAIAIPPGVVHRIHNPGSDDLVFLCCCVPHYTHEDTILLELTELDPG